MEVLWFYLIKLCYSWRELLQFKKRYWIVHDKIAKELKLMVIFFPIWYLTEIKVARVENLRNRVIVPQRTNERTEDAPSFLRMRSVRVLQCGIKRIVPSRDSRKLVVMTTKIRKEQVIFTRHLSWNPYLSPCPLLRLIFETRWSTLRAIQ